MGYIAKWQPYGPNDAKWLGEMGVEMYLEYLSPETPSPAEARCAPLMFNTIQCFTWNTGPRDRRG